jgi:hypothetical protein
MLARVDVSVSTTVSHFSFLVLLFKYGDGISPRTLAQVVSAYIHVSISGPFLSAFIGQLYRRHAFQSSDGDYILDESYGDTPAHIISLSGFLLLLRPRLTH